MTSSNLQYPLRPRGALELFDVSLKLYKKYFWPLLGVSALVWLGIAFVQLIFTSSFNDLAEGVVIAILLSAIPAFLLLPFLYGAGGCCLVAAIEARDVGFRDCMRFAAKRYGKILSAISETTLSAFFAGLIYILLLMLIAFVLTLIVNVIPGFDNLAIYPCLLAIATFFTLMGLFLVGFYCLIPLIACFEEKQKAVKLRKRCYMISRSGAKPLVSLVFLNGLGVLVLLVILGGLTGVGASLILAQHFMRGTTSEASSLLSVFAAITSFTFVGMIWLPFYLLTLGTFYTDVRIRKEAFDLEWAVREQPTELVF